MAGYIPLPAGLPPAMQVADNKYKLTKKVNMFLTETVRENDAGFFYGDTPSLMILFFHHPIKKGGYLKKFILFF